MIKAVIFDFWGTLFYENIKGVRPFRKFAKIIGKNIDDYSYLKIFESHIMKERHLNLNIAVENLLKELNINYNKKLILKLTALLKKEGTIEKPYPETFEVLKKLKTNYKLGLITNTYYYSFKKIEQMFDITNYFDVILKSYETKILKPDPKIYEIMLNKLKVQRDEVLMVGDSLKDDVQAAEKIGIKGLLIDRNDKYPTYQNRIKSLEELRKYL